MGSLSEEVRTEVLCGHICDLEAENAKLRDENARLRSCLSDDANDARQIMSENAKLRELVKDLHALAYGVLPERKTDYITICSVESCIDYYSRTMPAIEQRMRELGVEVDE